MNTPVPDHELIPWYFLKDPKVQILNQLLTNWEAMLKDESNKEEVYQQFIAENSGLFFGTKKIVISKVPLGADHITDFVIAWDRASYGFAYEFVELESPHTPAFTRKNYPSARLNMAVQQLLSWKNWLDANRGEAKKLFPSKLFTLHDSPSFDFTIYIGRSEHHNEQLALRNKYADHLHVNIHGFDYLTRSLSRPEVDIFPHIYSSEMDSLPAHVRNQLANPFTSAYSWGAWRGIVKQPEFSDNHMLTDNRGLLLKHRTFSAAHEKFLALWHGLPSERKEFYFSLLRHYKIL